MKTRASQSCFDNGILLTVRSTGQTRYDINKIIQVDYLFQLDMPQNVTCTQCILQWKYNTGMEIQPFGKDSYDITKDIFAYLTTKNKMSCVGWVA